MAAPFSQVVLRVSDWCAGLTASQRRSTPACAVWRGSDLGLLLIGSWAPKALRSRFDDFPEPHYGYRRSSSPPIAFDETAAVSLSRGADLLPRGRPSLRAIPARAAPDTSDREITALFVRRCRAPSPTSSFSPQPQRRLPPTSRHGGFYYPAPTPSCSPRRRRWRSLPNLEGSGYSFDL